MRKLENLRNSNVNTLKINFEDLVLNYNDTLKKIEDYLGLQDVEHINKLKHFNPKKSINNLQIFNRKKEYKIEASIIEEELKEYLYPFPIIELDQNGDVF